MAQVDENWQTKCSSISQRTKFVFNKELLSDVKFVVPVSNGQSGTKVIPAHKLVLAIGSPVFHAMFYGQMAETKDSIELPDCEYESLLELFRYMYSDEVKLTGSNVMRVLYLAKKYMVPSLGDKCTEYLRKNLEASNVFAVLPQAQKFEDRDLEDRCWKVIEGHTEEAVTSDEFVALERSLVEAVVKKECLHVKEVELFKAVDHWAKRESERQGITPDGKVKRRIIGEEILKEIRFPLMSQKEFASVVIDSMLLNVQEIGDMVKYYTDVLTSPLAFKRLPRSSQLKSPVVYRCHRFGEIKPPDTRWNYGGCDGVCVTVNKAIKLHGVQYFGSQGGNYTVTTEIKDVANGSSLSKRSGSYSSKKENGLTYYGFDVPFDPPINLEKDRWYDIVSNIKGPRSWYGEQGKTATESNGVQFTFSRSSDSSNGTSDTIGQIPAFLFSC